MNDNLGVKVNRCIYKKTPFQTADGEHILQNFLGARWTSTEISSNEAQHSFGSSIDVALAEGLKEIRNLLGTRGGRGETGPSLKNIMGSAGTKFTVAPGGKPDVSEPSIKTMPLPDGSHQVQVVLGNMKQLGWAVAKLKEMYPDANFDIKELRQNAVAQSGYVGEYLNLKSGLGGDDFFRGALKAVFNLLGACAPDTALLSAFDDVRSFILEGTGDCKNFVRWLTTSEEVSLPRIGDFDQFVGVFSRDGVVDGYIQFYGEIGYLIRLAENFSGQDFCYGYVVDPFREGTPAENRNPKYSKENIPAFESGSALPGETVWPVYSTRFSRILERYYRRADEQNLSRIVDDVLLPHDGKQITKEMITELSGKAAEYMVHRLFMSRPR
ncbi:hypothetical protein AB4Y38_39430 [Paraburkholderia sp. EG285A]|uniref:hypothetical protein n=1 Tax=Paraburkholderia sp. EG285A TaxID=3237009 RepID=UPI0034D37936